MSWDMRFVFDVLQKLEEETTSKTLLPRATDHANIDGARTVTELPYRYRLTEDNCLKLCREWVGVVAEMTGHSLTETERGYAILCLL